MLRSRFNACVFLFGAGIVSLLTAPDAEARRSASSNLQLLDTNKDKRIELSEAKQGADAVFTRLDTDKNGTLDARELKGRLKAGEATVSGKAVSWPLSRADYLAIVEERFKAADSGKDGKLSLQQIITPAGGRLIELTVYVNVR